MWMVQSTAFGVLLSFIANQANQVSIEHKVSSFPCFTEGIQLYDGLLYESCTDGLIASLGFVEPWSGKLLKQVFFDLSLGQAPSGLLVHDGVVFVAMSNHRNLHAFDADSLSLLGKIGFRTVSKEGFGMTTDGHHMIMSSGTDCLTYYSLPLRPESDSGKFGDLYHLKVVCAKIGKRRDPNLQLGDVEYVYGTIIANVRNTDRIG